MKRSIVLGAALAALLITLLATLLAAPSASATPGPPRAPEYWFDRWHVESLWGNGARGQGVTIAEIDSGVNAKLAALRGRILSGHDFGAKGNGQIDRDRNPFGHGTAMASIMVGRPGPFDITGVAPAAKILPLAVPLKETTTAGQPDRVPQAIRYAANHHADIINLSLGSRQLPSFESQPCDDAEQAAIYYALRKGALVIASVGNTGPTKNTVEDPGVCLGVISVGAVNSSGAVARFSAREPYLTLVAPGVNVPSLGRIPDQAFSGSGTSQASALTSAVAALVWSAHPGLGARGVAARILATLDAHRSRPSPAYGYGELDAYRAVTATVPASAPNPVYDAVAPFMSRAAALNHRPAKPMPATRRSRGALGTYRVGTVPWPVGQAALGLGLAVYGLSLIIVLAALGLDRRGRRRPAHPDPDRKPDPGPVPPGPSLPASGQFGPEWQVMTAHSGPIGPLDEEAGQPAPRPPSPGSATA